MRQPLKLTSSLAIASKSAFRSAPARAFHSSRPTNSFFTSRTTSPLSTLVKARNAFRGSRTYMQQPANVQNPNGTLLQKLVVGGAMFGGTLFAINMVYCPFPFLCYHLPSSYKYRILTNTRSSTAKPVKMAECPNMNAVT